MKEHQEQFECEYCGAKFNFRKDAEEHERNCSAKRGGAGHTGNLRATFSREQH